MPVSETVVPVMLQTLELAGSTVRVTARPELAAAETEYVAPPTVAAEGAVDVNVIDCGLADGATTVNDCCTWVAA